MYAKKRSPEYAQRDRRLQTSADDVTAARNRINWCLTWAPLSDFQRQQLTLAYNALDLASECLSFDGPCEHTTLKF